MDKALVQRLLIFHLQEKIADPEKVLLQIAAEAKCTRDEVWEVYCEMLDAAFSDPVPRPLSKSKPEIRRGLYHDEVEKFVESKEEVVIINIYPEKRWETRMMGFRQAIRDLEVPVDVKRYRGNMVLIKRGKLDART